MAIGEYKADCCLNRTTTGGGMAALFSPSNLQLLQSIMRFKSFSAGAYLFWEGERTEALYYVEKGSVKITKSTDGGSKITLYLHHAGDLLGSLDPFQDGPQPYDAEVTEDAVIGVIHRKDLESLLKQHGELAFELMKWMGMMHRITQTKLRDLIMYGKPGALCSLLIRLSNSYGIAQGSDIRIGKKMTHSDMAELIGATRESVNRMLADMKKEEAIAVEQGTIVIKDIDYLRDICHCENCPKEICRV
ncbi:Crp/Fnr family transcriptional regulator [Paenibacillus sp. TAB 01]|uniref:Crp/Fnr family transcriptional regulator n=1 Tax=Paenibacillus sp. TAB 01 TaxID=3368988 RepID=UPI0037503474